MHDSRRVRLVLGVLLVAALALITLDVRDPGAGPLRSLRAFGGSLFGTAESAVGSVTRPVAGLFGAAGGGASAARVASLEHQVAALRAQLSLARLSKADEAQLQRLLQLAGRGGYRIVAATVIAQGPSYEDRVTIDAGSADGIAPQETVLNGSGLVGTVTSVTSHTASVLLLTDATSRVGVSVAGTGQDGLVSGTGQSQTGAGLLQLQVFDASAVLRPGEQLVTFASVADRPYVPGVPVGTIEQVNSSASSLTKTAVVRPFADVGSLGVVGVVIAPPRTNPRFSVLPSKPPSPTPSASATAPARHATPTASPSSTATSTGAGKTTGG